MHGVYAPAVFFNEYLYVITRKSAREAFQHLELPHPNAWACLALLPTREAQRGEQGSFQTESYNGKDPCHICCMYLCERGKGIGGRKFGGRKCEAACRFLPRFGRGQHATRAQSLSHLSTATAGCTTGASPVPYFAHGGREKNYRLSGLRNLSSDGSASRSPGRHIC